MSVESGAWNTCPRAVLNPFHATFETGVVFGVLRSPQIVVGVEPFHYFFFILKKES